LSRALEMERRALAGEGQSPQTTGTGLGRYFSWKDFLDAVDKQSALDLSDAGAIEACYACYDGE